MVSRDKNPLMKGLSKFCNYRFVGGDLRNRNIDLHAKSLTSTSTHPKLIKLTKNCLQSLWAHAKYFSCRGQWTMVYLIMAFLKMFYSLTIMLLLPPNPHLYLGPSHWHILIGLLKYLLLLVLAFSFMLDHMYFIVSLLVPVIECKLHWSRDTVSW